MATCLIQKKQKKFESTFSKRHLLENDITYLASVFIDPSPLNTDSLSVRQSGVICCRMDSGSSQVLCQLVALSSASIE